MNIFFERFRDVISDPINEKIERCDKSGIIEDNYVYMHNGVKIYRDSYYGEFSDILILNKGVHEPQEEYAFSVVLNNIRKKDPIMLELGSYWAFYSLSLISKIPESRCFMIEPGDIEIEKGISNFKLNNKEGRFIKGKIGFNEISVDDFVISEKIPHIDILHSDIQGYELEMLNGSINSLRQKIIDYIFIVKITKL